MTEQLCDFPVCKLAKEKGFDEGCMEYWEWYIFEGEDHGPNAYGRKPIDFRKWAVRLEETQAWPLLYNKTFWPQKNSELPPHHYTRPSQSLLVRWLREKHRINVNVYPELRSWNINIYLLTKRECIWHSNAEHPFDNPEEALEFGLLTALNLIK